jgi:hypothetical protein
VVARNADVDAQRLMPNIAINMPQPGEQACDALREAAAARPRMPLGLWGVFFGVSDDILRLLENIAVEGPHALAWISDHVLRDDAQLPYGSVAQVRNAFLRWLNNDSKDAACPRDGMRNHHVEYYEMDTN